MVCLAFACVPYRVLLHHPSSFLENVDGFPRTAMSKTLGHYPQSPFRKSCRISSVQYELHIIN